MGKLSKTLLIAFVPVALAAGTFQLLTIPAPMDKGDIPAHEPDLANGKLMFWAGGCGSCHSAGKAMGDEKLKLGGGLRLATDFGTFVAPNISPDIETGIGSWSDLDFVNAMKLGIAPDGSHLYPAFPYASYQRMKVTDILDLKAFLDTLPAVDNRVGQNELDFPYNVRRGLGLWKLLYLDGDGFEPDSALSEEENRGKYLVEGPSHCGECHSPRDLFGGMDDSKWLAGAQALEGEGFVPNITPSKDGIGDWTAEDIAYSLESGFTPEFDSFGGAMVSVQDNMANLPEEDRLAIGRYLKSIAPLPSAGRR